MSHSTHVRKLEHKMKIEIVMKKVHHFRSNLIHRTTIFAQWLRVLTKHCLLTCPSLFYFCWPCWQIDSLICLKQKLWKLGWNRSNKGWNQRQNKKWMLLVMWWKKLPFVFQVMKSLWAVVPYPLLSLTKVNIGAELGCVCDSRKEEEPLIPVTIDQQSVEGVSSLKYLGRVVDLKLTFSSNIV